MITPTLDKLASEALVFDKGYVTVQVWVKSGLLTALCLGTVQLQCALQGTSLLKMRIITCSYPCILVPRSRGVPRPGRILQPKFVHVRETVITEGPFDRKRTNLTLMHPPRQSVSHSNFRQLWNRFSREWTRGKLDYDARAFQAQQLDNTGWWQGAHSHTLWAKPYSLPQRGLQTFHPGHPANWDQPRSWSQDRPYVQ